jgi:hypothetical protein
MNLPFIKLHLNHSHRIMSRSLVGLKSIHSITFYFLKYRPGVNLGVGTGSSAITGGIMTTVGGDMVWGDPVGGASVGGEPVGGASIDGDSVGGVIVSSGVCTAV